MAKRIAAILLIYVCACLAWMVLGSVTFMRTYSQDDKLKGRVARLWGTPLEQQAPAVSYRTETARTVRKTEGGTTTSETVRETVSHPVPPEASDIAVKIGLDYRRKGLLWYSTYRVDFAGSYRVRNTTDLKREIFFAYKFPTEQGVYDNFLFSVDGRPVDAQPGGGTVSHAMSMAPGEERTVEVRYRTQGMDTWWYRFGENVALVKNFRLALETDFDRPDFPENSVSPTAREKTPGGWRLTWNYTNLVSGIQIGVEMPKRLNPGPFAGKVTFFAPVSLFFFLFIMVLVTTIRKVRVHPMNYFFVSAAFFSFHLLMAYLIDHVNLHAAFVICSAVSIFLVVSYMRLVAGMRFALLEVGLSQLVYLVLFSYSFFLEGYTGLTITVFSILTLFVLMQATGRIDWEALSKTAP